MQMRAHVETQPPETARQATTEPPTGGAASRAADGDERERVVWVGADRCCRGIAPDACRRIFREFPRLIRDTGDAADAPERPASSHTVVREE